MKKLTWNEILFNFTILVVIVMLGYTAYRVLFNPPCVNTSELSLVDHSFKCHPKATLVVSTPPQTQQNTVLNVCTCHP